MNSICIRKEEIISKIIASQKECSFLGVSNIDLDLRDNVLGQKTLQEIMQEKFSQLDSYIINVIVEDVPQLAKEVQNGNTRLLLKDLIGKKEAFTTEFRNFFVAKKTNNIEPTEDVCRKASDEMFYKTFIGEIENRLLRNEVEGDVIIHETIDDLTKRIQAMIVNKIRDNALYKTLLAEEKHQDLHYINLALNGDSISVQIKQMFADCNSFKTLYVEIEKMCKSEFIFQISNSNIRFKLDLSKDEKSIIAMMADAILTLLFETDQEEYEMLRKQAAEFASSKRKKYGTSLESDPQFKQRLFVKVFCDDIFLKMLKIDDEYFLVSSDGDDCMYKKTEDQDFIKYFQRCINNKNVAQLTKKGNKKEIVPCYIENVNSKDKNKIRIRIGQRSRDAFNFAKTGSMVFIKNVIWALIFDRNGNLLLHKRGMNAKDNQDMWDKSVGGHISIDDPDSVYGARREIVEELYTKEEAEQGHSQIAGDKDPPGPNPEWIIFLGQWDKTRYPQFSESLRSDTYMKLKDNESYCFKYDCPLTDEKIISKRILVDGSEVLANCFVDLFFVITAKDFDTQKLQNSEYLLARPQDIKRYFEAGFVPQNVVTKGSKETRFVVTPDLNEMLMDKIWDNDITAFSDAVKAAFSK